MLSLPLSKVFLSVALRAAWPRTDMEVYAGPPGVLCYEPGAQDTWSTLAVLFMHGVAPP